MKTTVELLPGLPKKELVERIYFYQRQGEVADRALGFYLLDMQRRKEYRPFKDACQWARKHLGGCHRVDKLMLLAKHLEDLPQIEAAFDGGEVPWTKIREIARITVQEHGGVLPCDRDTLLAFHGVGPKCANLALGIACNLPLVGVDVHVHRVTNRWGYVATKRPEKTMAALQEKLPKRYWVEINALLVPFGKHMCTGQLPKCSTCPLLEMCQQVGVTRHR